MAGPTIEGKRSFLGFGLIRPFQRAGGNDFLVAGDVRLIASAIGQILGTKPGDLRWRPSFGVDLERVRHKNLTEENEALALALSANALSQFEPRIEFSVAKAEKKDTTLKITVEWQVIAANTPRNQVLLGPVTTEVEI